MSEKHHFTPMNVGDIVYSRKWLQGDCPGSDVYRLSVSSVAGVQQLLSSRARLSGRDCKSTDHARTMIATRDVGSPLRVPSK
jgi:hypothetical protein